MSSKIPATRLIHCVLHAGSLSVFLALFLLPAVLAAGNEAKKTFPPGNGAANEQKKTAAPDSFGDAEYRLGSGDVIEVFVWKEPDLSTTAVVRPDGNISLPLVGEMRAGDKTASELQAEIAAGLQKYVTTPVVNVVVKEVNSARISVLGQVRKPDSYKINRKTTVMEAIAMAGGFTDFARRSRIMVIRNTPSGKRTIKVNFTDLVRNSGTETFYLQPTDTVYVE